MSRDERQAPPPAPSSSTERRVWTTPTLQELEIESTRAGGDAAPDFDNFSLLS